MAAASKNTSNKNSAKKPFGGKGSKRKKQKLLQNKKVITAIVIVAILLFIGLWLYDYFYSDDGGSGTPPYAYGEGDAAVHFVDVGQGDSIIIQFPDGKNMIIDGGDITNKSRTKVKEYVSTLGISRFDFVMLTHSDADHCGGLSTVLSMAGLSFGKIYMPYIKSSANNDPINDTDAKKITTNAYRDFVSAAVTSEAEIIYSQGGLTETGEGYSLTIYTPVSMSVYNIRTSNSGDINNVSPIMVLEYNGKRVMFTGDAQSEGEAAFVSFVNSMHIESEVRVDVLKVAHHGSSGSSTQAFLDIVKPAYAVISSGAGNSYGHPHQEALSRLIGIGAAVFRTDASGDIVCTLTEDSQILWYTGKDGSVTLAVVTTDSFEALFISFSLNTAAEDTEKASA